MRYFSKLNKKACIGSSLAIALLCSGLAHASPPRPCGQTKSKYAYDHNGEHCTCINSSGLTVHGVMQCKVGRKTATCACNAN